MRKVRLGETGLEVGCVGLGCMGMTFAYADGQDERASIEVIHRAIELGVTLLDTADMYGPYTNEELVGRAIADRRDHVVLATKGGLVHQSEAAYDLRRDGRPEHLRAACEASLRRLGTDRIDLYQLHRVDSEVPLAESWGALARLVEEGKVRALGLSEATIAELSEADAIHPVSSVQSELSLWSQDTLSEVLPYCQAHHITFIAFAPLGRGFLTGAAKSADTLDKADFRASNPRFQPDAFAHNQRIVEGIRSVAERVGATPAQVALAWALARGQNVLPIPGTKRLRYLEENAAAARLELTEADHSTLDALPAPMGTRY